MKAIRKSVFFTVIATVNLTIPSESSAQSLEQAYRTMCSDAAKSEEACRVLAQGLAEKQSSAVTPEAIAGPVLAASEVNQTWGILSSLVGRVWHGPDGYWRFQWDTPDQQIRIRHYDFSGKERKGLRTIIKRGSDDRLLLSQVTRESRVLFLKHGNFFDDTFDEAFILESPNTFVLERGTYKNGAYHPSAKQRKSRNGVYRRLSASDEADFYRRVSSREQGGSGGLGGMLSGAIAGASGMLNGGGGNDAAIAGAAAGAVAGAAGVGSNSINQGFREGAADVNARNAQLEADMARARTVAGGGAPVAGSAGSSTGGGKTAAASAPAGEALSKRTVSAYFWVSTVPSEQDDHNTHCASTVFPITIDWNERGWGNGERVAAVMEPMMSIFLAKCQRLKPITSAENASYSVEGVGSYAAPTFRRGDTQVAMP